MQKNIINKKVLLHDRKRRTTCGVSCLWHVLLGEGGYPWPRTWLWYSPSYPPPPLPLFCLGAEVGEGGAGGYPWSWTWLGTPSLSWSWPVTDGSTSDLGFDWGTPSPRKGPRTRDWGTPSFGKWPGTREQGPVSRSTPPPPLSPVDGHPKWKHYLPSYFIRGW